MNTKSDQNRSELLSNIYRDKPEMVALFPQWALTEADIAVYRRMNDLAIVEIAGRDSVAAAVQAAAQNGYGNLLPVCAYTGTEYGAWRNVEEAVNRLALRLPEIRIHPLLVVGSPGFWRALNGRFVPDLMDSFGHYTPCTGCHLYLHAIRIPLARMLGNIPIIAGERKSHNGSIKINQIPEAIEFYSKFTASFGVRLDLPLANITDDQTIAEILKMPWERGRDQLGCVLSGNYKRSTGEIDIQTTAIKRFYDRFAGPASELIVREYLENRLPDHEGIAGQIIDRCRMHNQSESR